MSEPPVIELRSVGLPGCGSPRPGASWHGRRVQPASDRPARGWGPGRKSGHRDHPPDPRLVHLSVWRAELVTITGPAGSGKSALLHVIGLVDRPATGSYLLNGQNTAKLGDRDRAALRGRMIGAQLQRPYLLPARTALDNVLLPLRYAGLPRRQRDAAALAALDRVGLADQASRSTAELSAGERKLVAIARALAADPDLLLFDDPTGCLDSATAAQIVSLLIALHRAGKTVLVATDDQLAHAYRSRRVTLGAAAELSARA